MCTPVVATAKPMCTFDKVLNQRVDWVAWASIEYGALDAIDDERAQHASLPSPRPHIACACVSTKEKWFFFTRPLASYYHFHFHSHFHLHFHFHFHVHQLPSIMPYAWPVARLDSCLTHTGRCIFVIYRYTPAHVRRTIHEAWFRRLGLHINGQFSCSNS